MALAWHEFDSGSTQREMSRIGLCISLAITILFLQIVREWVGREAVAVRESLLRNPALDGFVRSTHATLLGWARAAIGMAAVTAFAWLAWQYQAHRQLKRLSPRARLSPLVALVSWAIPVVNLVAPFAAHEELMLRGDPEEGSPDAGNRWWPAVFVVIWWLLFVASAAILVGALVAPPIDAATVHDWVHRDQLLARALWIAMAGGLVAAIMVIWIDVRLSRKLVRTESRHREAAWVGWMKGGPSGGAAEGP